MTRPVQKTRDGPFLPSGSDVTPSLSVVLPTMNEGEGIGECLEAIGDAVEELGVPTEVIVSDSSTDRTPDIAHEYGAIVVEPDRAGYGYAYQYAFERTRGEYVAMGDADTTYDFRELPKLLDTLQQTDADIVLGSRFDGEIKPGAMPGLHQYVGNPALTRFLNQFYGADVSDAHSGFRVLRKNSLDELQLRTDGMEFASEMIMEASARGMRIEEVPITYHERTGDAKIETFRDGWRHVRFMLVNAPGYLFSVPGAILFAVGIFIMALTHSGATVTGVSGRPIWFGVRSMVAGSLLTIVGYQVASLGLFATLASNPIRRPTDRVTTWLVENLSLEGGIVFGLIISLIGSGYAAFLVVQWLQFGYEVLPAITHDIFAFTLIVLGIQTVFGTFFVSSLRFDRKQ